MRREATIPTEFVALANVVNYVQRWGAYEYSSSCPECGGAPHPGGELPDRFRMFLDGKVRGWCRKCDYKWFPDMADPDWRPDAEEIARRALEAEAALQRSIEQAQSALEELRAARRWLEYHEQMDMNGRMNWNLRGVPEFWQNWWKLGCTADYGGFASLTIPVWGNGWEVNNIKHRFIDPSYNGPKYIQEKRGIPASAFVCDPERTDGHLLVCEGEIKSMVTFSEIDSNTIQVIGLPSATPSADMIAPFLAYDPIYICPDPDTFIPARNGAPTAAERLASLFGVERVRVIELPDKIDDLIVEGHLDKAGLRQAFKRARRL